MFALLILPSAALAWRPAPGIPLERQLPANRQTSMDYGSGSGGCDFDPWIQECNATEIWCDSGYYNDNTCWYGNYCLQQISDWDGGALVFATNLATGKPRTSATWVWTRTTAGWATIVRTRALVDALLLLLAALTTALPLALDPALKLTPRSATARRSIATLVWTP